MLRKIRSIFKSQKFLSLISNGLGAALGLISFALLTRTLSKSELGVWSIFLAVAGLFDMVRNGLVGKPLIKFLAETEDPERESRILGSSWLVGLRSTVWMSIVISLVFGGIGYWGGKPDYYLYVYFFLPVALASLPMNMARWVLNARIRFDQMLWIRLFMQVVYFTGIGLEYFYNIGLWFIFLTFLVSNLVSSLITLIAGWGEARNLRYHEKETTKELFTFGKYSMGSLISGSLLRSSDTFIIGIFLGERAVALYEVPQRLVNLIDIPLRALVSYSFPTMAKAYKQAREEDFRREFDRATGFAFLMLLPVAILSFVFAEELVVLLAGEEYAEAKRVMQMFAIYMGFTAVDRYWGVGLDVINKPKRNYHKVIAMLVVNIVGDLIAVQLSDDVSWVAFVSIFTFGGGIIFGSLFLRGHVNLNPLKIVREGSLEIRRVVNNLVRK